MNVTCLICPRCKSMFIGSFSTLLSNWTLKEGKNWNQCTCIVPDSYKQAKQQKFICLTGNPKLVKLFYL